MGIEIWSRIKASFRHLVCWRKDQRTPRRRMTMSDNYQAGRFTNDILRNQIEKMGKDGAPSGLPQRKGRPNKPQMERTTKTPAVARPALVAETSMFNLVLPEESSSGSEDVRRQVQFGLVLDQTRKLTSDYALAMIALWREISHTDRTSLVYGLLTDRAATLARDYVSFLERDEQAGVLLAPNEKQMLARISAMQYAATVWGASEKDVPDAETGLAVWFLLKTGAAEVANARPYDSEAVSVLPNKWLVFPSVMSAESTAESTEWRVFHESGLSGVLGRIVKIAQKDGKEFAENHIHAKNQATVQVKDFFTSIPAPATFILSVRSQYLSDSRQFIGGGEIVVQVRGNASDGFTICIMQVVDNTVLTDLADAARISGMVLQLQFMSLSESFRRALPQGVPIASLVLPLKEFEGERLLDTRVDLGYREKDGKKFRVLCRISRIMRTAIKGVMFPRSSGHHASQQQGARDTERAEAAPPEVQSPAETPESEKEPAFVEGPTMQEPPRPAIEVNDLPHPEDHPWMEHLSAEAAGEQMQAGKPSMAEGEGDSCETPPVSSGNEAETIPGTKPVRRVSAQARKLVEERGLSLGDIQSADPDFLRIGDVERHIATMAEQ